MAGEVLPRSVSFEFSCAWSVGVQLCSSWLPSGLSSSTLSPQSVDPLNGALPVATRIRPVPGSTTAPARPQIAESLAGHVRGTISVWRSEHSEFHTRGDPTRCAIDRDHVALIGRRVADSNRPWARSGIRR